MRSVRVMAVVLALSFVSLAAAKPENVYSFELTPQSPARLSSSQESAVVAAKREMALLSAGPLLALISGGAGIGVGLSALFHTGIPVYFGLETGYYGWSASARSATMTASASLSAIPVLASAVYRHRLDSRWTVYGGLSFGIAIASGDANIDGSYFQGSGAVVQLHVRPGIELAVADSFGISLETKTGIIGTSFLFVPHLAAVLAL